MDRPVTALSWQMDASTRLGRAFPPAIRRAGPYAFVLVCVAIAAGIRGLFAIGIGADESPYLVFVAAVLASSLVCGTRMGLFATAVSVIVADVLFISPIGRLHLENRAFMGGGLFILEGAAVAVVGGRLRDSLLEIVARSRRQYALAELSRAALLTPDDRSLLRFAEDTLGEAIGTPVGAWLGEAGGFRAVRPNDFSPSWLPSSQADLENGDPMRSWAGQVQVRGGPASAVYPIPGESRPLGFIAVGSGRGQWAGDRDFLQTAASFLGAAVQKARDSAALRESEHRLLMAQSVANMGTWEWQIPSGSMTWSASLEALHGLAPGTFPGTFEAMRADVHPEDSALLMQGIERAMQSGHYDAQYRIVTPDGLTRWIATRGQVFLGPDGAPLRAVGISMDVTDQRIAEEELRRSEERLRLAQDAAQLGTWEWDSRLGEMFWSEGAERLHGFEPGTFPGTYEASVSRVLPADLPLLEECRTSMSVNGSAECEYRVVLPGGQERLIHLSGRQVDAGRSVGVHLDVTEHRRTEATLRQSESWFREMANGAPALIWVSGVDGKLTFLNEQWSDFTGREPQENLGDGWLNAVHPGDRIAVEEEYRTAFDARRPYEMEFRLRNYRGGYRWVMDRGRPLFHDAGSFAGYIGSCVDIADRRRAADSFELLADVGVDLSSSLDQDTTIAALARKVVPGFADWCVVSLATADGEIARVAAVHRDPAHQLTLDTLGENSAGRVDGVAVFARVIAGGEPVLIRQVSDEHLVSWGGPDLDLLRDLNLGSEMCVPLRARGRTIGAISFSRAESNVPYDTIDLDLGMEIAHRAALAIDNAGLYSESERRASAIRRANSALQFLADAGIELSRSLDHSDTLSQVASLAVPRFADVCFVDVIEDGGLNRVGVAAATAELEKAARRLRPRQPGGNPTREGVVQQIRAGRPVFIPEARQALVQAFAQDAEHLEALEAIDPRSVVIVPLVARGQVLGVVTLIRREGAEPYTTYDLAVAEQLGRRAGLSIDNARLYSESLRIETDLRRSNEVISFLFDAGAEMGSILDYEESLRKLANLAVSRVSDWCAIDLVDGADLRRVAMAHRDPAMVAMANELASGQAPGATWRPMGVAQVIRTGKARLYPEPPDGAPETTGDDAEARDFFRTFGVRSAMVVPLANRQGIFGAITFVLSEGTHRYGSADLAMAEELARRAGAAIENARLYTEAQDRERELVRANEAKDEFLGLMSHELRTPITVIHGGSRILRTRGDQLDEETRQGMFGDIERESARLARMLENLLALARVELDQEPIVEPVLVQRLVQRIISTSQLSPDRQVEVATAQGLPPVAGEPGYLEHVVRNLIGNADKYSPPGRPIEVDLRSDERGGVAVRVLDRGFGIGSDEAERIFERFYRSDRTAKLVGGAGMGLAVCKRLIEAMGGTIWARPREAGGLEVGFSLPPYEEMDL